MAWRCALLDLLGRERGVPISTLLGEPRRSSLAAHMLIDGEDAKALAREAEAAMVAGFDAVKVKVGSRPLSDHDARRLLEVRRAVGVNRIRVDANARWSEADTRVALRGMQALDLELCEQPVRADDFDAMRAAARGACPAAWPPTRRCWCRTAGRGCSGSATTASSGRAPPTSGC